MSDRAEFWRNQLSRLETVCADTWACGAFTRSTSVAVFFITKRFSRAYPVIGRFSPYPSLLLPNFRFISENRKVCRFYDAGSCTLRLFNTESQKKTGTRVPSLPEPCEFRYFISITDVMISLPQCRKDDSFRERRKIQCYTKSYALHSRRSMLRSSICRLMGLQSLPSQATTVRSHCGPNSNSIGRRFCCYRQEFVVTVCGEISGMVRSRYSNV